MANNAKAPLWALLFPLAAIVLLTAALLLPSGPLLTTLAAIVLVGTVFAAVYHAEVVAHRLGEPFGTLVLAVAVTIIEVALIVSVMVAAPEAKAGLARDTVFAAVMIVCNGIVGLCLLAGGVRHHEQGFQLKGASAALAVLAAMTVLTLILPNATTSAPGAAFSTAQLIFSGVISLVLYGALLFVQMVRHRDYFLPVGASGEDDHVAPPTAGVARLSAVVLMIALVAVVLIAKQLTPTIERIVATANAPRSVIAIAIAMLVLMPEGLAAVRAAQANRLQTSLNLALGSALASIGLTIPAVAVVSIMIGIPLQLGLDSKDTVLLALTLFLGALTLGTGRTTVLHGVIHLVVFAAFLFFAIVP